MLGQCASIALPSARRRALAALVSFLVFAVPWACGGSGSNTSVIPEPSVHRASAVTCSTERSNTRIPAGTTGSCSSDADCVNGLDGRCVFSFESGLACNYDACATDSDCTGADGVCTCGDGDTIPNICTSGDCRIDSDCGDGGYCSPSPDPCPQQGTVGYFCRTAHDTCHFDEDCADASNSDEHCAFNTTTRVWQCTPTGCPE